LQQGLSGAWQLKPKQEGVQDLPVAERRLIFFLRPTTSTRRRNFVDRWPRRW